MTHNRVPIEIDNTYCAGKTSKFIASVLIRNSNPYIHALSSWIGCTWLHILLKIAIEVTPMKLLKHMHINVMV